MFGKKKDKPNIISQEDVAIAPSVIESMPALPGSEETIVIGSRVEFTWAAKMLPQKKSAKDKLKKCKTGVVEDIESTHFTADMTPEQITQAMSTGLGSVLQKAGMIDYCKVKLDSGEVVENVPIKLYGKIPILRLVS